MKIKVCLGHELPKKINDDNSNENNINSKRTDTMNNDNGGYDDDYETENAYEDDSIGMMIFNHEDNYNHNHYEDSYFDSQLQNRESTTIDQSQDEYQ